MKLKYLFIGSSMWRTLRAMERDFVGVALTFFFLLLIMFFSSVCVLQRVIFIIDEDSGELID